MTRLSLGQRIAASFAFLILPVALVASFFLSQQASLFSDIRTNQLPEIAKSNFLDGHVALLVFEQKLSSAIFEKDRATASNLLNDFTLRHDHFASQGLLDDVDQVSGLSDAVIIIEGYRPEFNQLLGELSEAVNNDDWEAANVIIVELSTTSDEISQAVDQFVEGLNSFTLESDDTLAQWQMRTILFTLLAFGSILFLILLIGVLLTFSLSIPLNQIKESLRKWQSGDFSHRVLVSGQSELTEIGSTMNEVISLVESGRSRVYDNATDKEITSSDLLSDRVYGLETSLAIAQRVMSTPDLEVLLPQVSELLRQRYALYHVAVYLIDPQTDLLVLESGTLIDDKRTLPINEKSMPGWAAKHRRPGLAEDVRQDTRYYLSSKLSETRSELTLPLLIGRDLIGVLDLHSNIKAGFSRDSVLQFQSIADLIVMSIHNLRIVEGGRSRLHLADALKGIGESLIASNNLTHLLKLMLTHTKRLVDYDGATVSLWNGKMLEVCATSGDTLATKGIRITPDPNDPTDIFMRVQSAGRPYAIDVPDAELEDSHSRWHSLFLDGCWLAIPFMGETGIVGIVAFARHERTPFSAEDQAIAATIANQSWLVLENSHQKRQIKRVREQMEFELHSRTDAIQTAYAELDKLDQTKSRFVSIASHELRTPLTIIRGYSEILQKQSGIAGNQQNDRLVGGILKGVKRISEVVENLLDLTRIDYRTLEIRPEPIRLKDLFSNIESLIEDEIDARKIDLVVDESTKQLPIIDGDLTGMRKIFEHLINNAIKYTPDGGEIKITGRAWQGDGAAQLATSKANQIDWPEDGIHLQIKDSGIGIDPDDQELIFQKFFQTGEVDLHSSSKFDFRGGGPGLGLAIVRGIVTAHHGHVWAESSGFDDEKMPGSTFHVVLPRRQLLNDQTLRFDLPLSVISGASHKIKGESLNG